MTTDWGGGQAAVRMGHIQHVLLIAALGCALECSVTLTVLL